MTEVLIGLGSNRPYKNLDCIHLLASACKRMQSFLHNFSPSSVYKTAPMYLKEQNDFYNMTAGALYEGSAESLLEELHKVEKEFGRNRKYEVRNGERSLDLDIEFFGMQKINLPDLIVPHERIFERAFVLKPFLELLSENADVKRSGHFLNEKLPVNSETVCRKLLELQDQKIELCLEKQKFLEILES